jgi:Mrp family chromosome partitioning ATPase
MLLCSENDRFSPQVRFLLQVPWPRDRPKQGNAMKVNASGNGAAKVLGLIKKNSEILYPDLIVPRGEALGAVANSEYVSPPPPLFWQDLPLLQQLRGSLGFIWGRLVLQRTESKRDIAFYGCSQQVGTTFIAFHLAAFAAMSHGLRTIYVDTDCDTHPENSHPIGQTDLPGLLSFYYEGAALEDCIYPTRIPNFSVLPSGRKVVGQQEDSFPPTERIKKLVQGIHDAYDVAIYDCQPVLEKPIEISFAQYVHDIILVSRYAVSRREVCEQTIEAFKDSNLAVSGVVLNQREYPVPKKIYDWLK